MPRGPSCQRPGDCSFYRCSCRSDRRHRDQRLHLRLSADSHGTDAPDQHQCRRHSRFGKAPMNQFANLPAFPDATYTDVVRPNVDTLYSLMWFDVSQEPLLISVPDLGGRYYLLRCATCGPTCSTARASERPGQARRCWRSPGQVGKAISLQTRRSFIAPRGSAGSLGAHRPTAKPTTTPSANSRPDSSPPRSTNGASRT